MAGPYSGAASGPGEDGRGLGVYVPPGTTSSATVVSSILSRTDSSCASNDPANAMTCLAVVYGVTHACGATTTENATVSSLVSGDPEFADLAADDVHTTSMSPAVDSGDPSATCSLEPAPNGCRANCGSYGNTAEAAARAGATHCAVCP